MFILTFITVLMASLVAGLTGFGFAIVAVPILMILMPPKVVVPLVQLLSAVLQIAVLIEARMWINLKRMWPLLLAGIMGVPLGTYLLLILAPQTLRTLVGAVVVVSAWPCWPAGGGRCATRSWPRCRWGWQAVLWVAVPGFRDHR